MTHHYRRNKHNKETYHGGRLCPFWGAYFKRIDAVIRWIPPSICLLEYKRYHNKWIDSNGSSVR